LRGGWRKNWRAFGPDAARFAAPGRTEPQSGRHDAANVFQVVEPIGSLDPAKPPIEGILQQAMKECRGGTCVDQNGPLGNRQSRLKGGLSFGGTASFGQSAAWLARSSSLA